MYERESQSDEPSTSWEGCMNVTGKIVAALLTGTCLVPAGALAQTTNNPSDAATIGTPSNPEASAQAAGVAADPAAAGQTGGAADIVVTATRRAQNLQDIPIAISAVGSAALEVNRVTNILDVQGLVPGLQVNRNNAVVSFTLRGVGSNFRVQGVDTTVAVHTDGVYISSPNAIQASLFDLERIEVVKGPQGVLYGRGASGGAVNLISKLPTNELSGSGQATYGNYDLVELEGVISGPIVADKVLVRVGGFYRDRDGYGRNTFTGQDNNDLHEYGVKGTLQVRPSDTVQLILRGDYYRGKDNGQGTDALPGADPSRSVAISPAGVVTSACTFGGPCAPGKTLAETRGGVIAPRPRDSNGNIQTTRDLQVYGFSGEFNAELTDRLALKSLTGYRHVDSKQTFDQDQTQISINDPFIQNINGGQFSQELQLSYRGKGFYAIVGGYYFHEKRDVYFFQGVPALSFLPAPNSRDVQQVGYTKTDAGAVFGNVDIDITSKLTLGLGARYSSETRGTQGTNAAIFGPAVFTPFTDKTFNAFTPRATVTYEFTPALTAFASVSRGFKSGQYGVAIPRFARPEFLTDIEGGLKGRLFNNAARFELGAFHYHFKDIQLQLFQGATNVITNADTGTAYGAEASFDVDLPAAFRFHADALLEHSEYGNLPTNNPNLGANTTTNFVNLSGNRFPYTPKFSYNASLEKDIEVGSLGTGTFRVEDQYNSKTYLDIYQNDNAARPAYHIVNASYRQQLGERFSALFWVRNLTDKTVVMAANFGFPFIGATRLVNFNPPRTYGITLRANF